MDIWVVAIGGGAKLAHWLYGGREWRAGELHCKMEGILFLVDLQVIDL